MEKWYRSLYTADDIIDFASHLRQAARQGGPYPYSVYVCSTAYSPVKTKIVSEISKMKNINLKFVGHAALAWITGGVSLIGTAISEYANYQHKQTEKKYQPELAAAEIISFYYKGISDDSGSSMTIYYKWVEDINDPYDNPPDTY